jgi:hypothetical protein
MDGISKVIQSQGTTALPAWNVVACYLFLACLYPFVFMASILSGKKSVTEPD